MNLDKLIDQWIGEEKELWQPKPFPKGKEGILDNETAQIALQNAREMTNNTWNHAYNAKIQDLKSRKQELIEGIVGIIKNIKEDGSTDDTPLAKGVQSISNPDMLKGWKACRYEIIKELTAEIEII